MKTINISKVLLTLGLVLVLGSAITPVHGGTQPSAASEIDSSAQGVPLVTIHSVTTSPFNGGTGIVVRGETGVFVLRAKPQTVLARTFVNFSVSGTAIPGVDYTPVVSPAFIGESGFGVILIKTLRFPGAAAKSVVVTLEPGPGYAVGQPRSAQILIKP